MLELDHAMIHEKFIWRGVLDEWSIFIAWHPGSAESSSHLLAYLSFLEEYISSHTLMPLEFPIQQ